MIDILSPLLVCPPFDFSAAPVSGAATVSFEMQAISQVLFTIRGSRTMPVRSDPPLQHVGDLHAGAALNFTGSFESAQSWAAGASLRLDWGTVDDEGNFTVALTKSTAGATITISTDSTGVHYTFKLSKADTQNLSGMTFGHLWRIDTGAETLLARLALFINAAE